MSDAAGEDTFQNDFQQDANYPDVDLSDFDPPPPVKGGGVLLRVVAFSLAAWCHALAPLGGKWGAGATANGFTGVSLFATPLQWFGVAFITSALVSGVFCRFMNRKRLFQPIREEGPSSHKDSRTKTKTPTAGGVAFVPAGCLVALFFTKCGDPAVNAVVAVTLAFLAIGAVDDFGKLKAGANDSGLKPRVKFTAQCAAATAFVCLLYFLSTAGIIRETSTTVSFGFGFVMDFVAQMVFGATRVGSRSGVVQDVFLPLGGFLFYALSAFAIVAESNAVNVTDGVDGLASSLCAIAFVGLGVVCLAGGAASLGAFAIAMAGASCGFLVINRHPAAMFMGDAGSLSLGAALGATAAAFGGGATFPLFVSTLVFVAEVVSVILQVGWFKITKKSTGKGERLFRMAPLHHHLELGGWGEVRVVATMCAFGALAAVLGVAVAIG